MKRSSPLSSIGIHPIRHTQPQRKPLIQPQPTACTFPLHQNCPKPNPSEGEQQQRSSNLFTPLHPRQVVVLYQDLGWTDSHVWSWIMGRVFKRVVYHTLPAFSKTTTGCNSICYFTCVSRTLKRNMSLAKHAFASRSFRVWAFFFLSLPGARGPSLAPLRGWTPSRAAAVAPCCINMLAQQTGRSLVCSDEAATNQRKCWKWK